MQVRTRKWMAASALVAAVATFVACQGFSGQDGQGGMSEDGGDAGDATAGDATADIDGATDVEAAADGGVCRGAFGLPQLVLAHNGQFRVDGITLSTSELDAFVTLAPVGALIESRSVFALHRKSVSDAFVIDTTEPLALGDAGPTPGAFNVGLSADDLTLYFAHRQDPDAGVLAIDIYETHRAAADSTFTSEAKFGQGVNDPTTNQFHPQAAGSNLYFAVAHLMNGAQTQRDLYFAPLGGASARQAITELNAPTTHEENPVPSRDELELFFASDRASPEAGATLVYVAERDFPSLSFSAPALVALDLDAAAGSIAPHHLSADRCRLYVVVNQTDVYVVSRAAQ